MKSPENFREIEAPESKEEENFQWMRGPDGEFYCPVCWRQTLDRLSQKDTEAGEETTFSLLDYFKRDSKPVLASEYYPGMKNEMCEKCQTFIPLELVEKVKRASKRRRQRQERLENKE